MDTLDVAVVSGEDRYADPWHDFPGTSQRIAELLRAQGLSAEVLGVETSEPVAARLIVVNAGNGGPDLPAEPGEAAARWREAVLAHALAGGPLLAVHAAVNTFKEAPRWVDVLGGQWVPGTSMHPPGGAATIQVADADHPITAGLAAELDIVDERYSHLDMRPTHRPLITHVHDHAVHPIVWVNEAGPDRTRVRVAVDTLGHDVAAYGDQRADLLRREVDWLLA